MREEGTGAKFSDNFSQRHLIIRMLLQNPQRSGSFAVAEETTTLYSVAPSDQINTIKNHNWRAAGAANHTSITQIDYEDVVCMSFCLMEVD